MKPLGVIILFMATILFQSIPAMAQENVERAKICEIMGCRDPFVSLVRDVPPGGEADISQMNVVAIVQDAEGRYALIKFPDGKYYIFQEGMSIGLHEGKIEKISGGSVLVREMKPDAKGRIMPVNTYLNLHNDDSGKR